MSDSRDDDADELSRGSRTSSELLDLVRAAEDEARMPTRQAPPSSAAQLVEADELLSDECDDATQRNGGDDRREDVVEVGDDAIDAPPSRPEDVEARHEIAARRAVATPIAPPAQSTAPLVAIALVFLLAGAALALLAR